MRLTPLERWIMNKTGIGERGRELLEEYQLGKLKETLSYVKEKSTFYKEHFKYIDENNIASLDEFRNVPFTSPEDLSGNHTRFLCVPQREISRIITLNSSGTSGNQKRICFNEHDINLTIDFFRYGMSCLTDETDRVLVLLPGSAYGSIGDLLKKALAQSKIECFVQGVLTDTEEASKFIEENNITCIVGIPMQVLYLSRVKREIFKNNIKKVLLSTDYVPDALVNELREQCGCRVFNHYGMTEMGYGGGVECEALNGYHMREGDLYFEIIDPDTGKALEDGQYGEVVFTTLTRQAMPLVRYRTGDIAAFSSEKCSCGTFLKTMKKVLGRIDNRVLTGENQFIYLRELDEGILLFQEVLDYKAYMSMNNELVIEITAESEELFLRVKDKIAYSVQKILNSRHGCKINAEIILSRDNKPSKIANSMIKRKLCDFRTGV